LFSGLSSKFISKTESDDGTTRKGANLIGPAPCGQINTDDTTDTSYEMKPWLGYIVHYTERNVLGDNDTTKMPRINVHACLESKSLFLKWKFGF